MRAPERAIADGGDDVLDHLYRALAAEVSHASRYLALSRLAAEAGLSRAGRALCRTAEQEWGHVSALMKRITELGGDLASRAVKASSSAVLARWLHPAGRSDLRSYLVSLLVASVDEDRSTIRLYADMCDKSWDADPDTAELALRSLIEETETEALLRRVIADWPDGP